MSTQLFEAWDRLSLSLGHKLRPWVRFALLPAFIGVITVAAGCERPVACEYRCTAEQDACPEGLTCDTVLSYCVPHGYSGTCDAETQEITVCKNERVELELPKEAPSDPELMDGLPRTAVIEAGKLTTEFDKRTVLAFGGPDEDRQYWRVGVVDDCPVVDATLPSLCVGENLSRTLSTRGGKGNLQFELLGEDAGFTLSDDGVLAGKATIAGEHELKVAVTDDRGLNTVRSLKLAVANDCPNVDGVELPAVCAGSGYECDLDLIGRSPVEILDLTMVEKDGKQLTAAEAQRWTTELKLAYRANGDGYVLAAAPEPSALGRYTLNFTLKNDVSIEQRERPLTVALCDTIPSEFTACAGQDFDFDLMGDENDSWEFLAETDPLSDRLFFVQNRLRGNLDAGRYEVRAGVRKDGSAASRLTTFSLTVLSSETTACQPLEGPTVDAGPDGGADAGDASSEPPAPPPLPQLLGCVGEKLRYQSAVPLSSATTWTIVDGALPEGLRLETDLVVGTPTQSQQGHFTVEGRSAGGVRLQQKHAFTILENCYYAFETLRQPTQIRLLVGHVLQDPATPTATLSTTELGTADADLFAFSPTGRALAFTTYEPVTGEAKAYVAELSVTGYDHSVAVDVVPLPLFPLNNRPLELKWSEGGALAMILDGDSVDPLQRRVVTFSETAPQTWQAVVDDVVTNAHSLEWLGSDVCLVGSGDPNNTGTLFNFVFCKSSSGGTKHWAGPAFDFADDMRIRAAASTLLAMAPVPDANDPSNNMDFVLGVDASNVLWSAVTHRGVYASPRGDMVAVPREDGSLELASPASPTDSPDLGLYTPIGSLSPCDIVVAWSPETGALACVPASDDTHVTIATFENGALDETFVATIAGHGLSTQRVFVDDRYYVIDAGWGKLSVVSLTPTPTVTELAVGSPTPTLMGLLPMPPLAAHSRVAVQSDGKLLAVDLDAESASQISVAGATLANASACTWSFHLSGYPNWCGGGETSRFFQMSLDAANFLYLDNNGKLHLSNTLGDTIISDAQCGSALNCSGQFAFGR